MIPYYLLAGSESKLGIKVDDVQQRFLEMIARILPNNVIVWYGLDEIQQALLSKVEIAKQIAGANSFLVSLSGLYYPWADYELHCTRVCDVGAEKLGITYRPPTKKSLTFQVSEIMDLAQSRPIIVIDDTLFHGETLDLLQRSGLKVNAVVEYVASTEVVQKFQNQGIAVYPVVLVDEYLDVMPLHDFLPGMPLCGKVVGEAKIGSVYPLLHQSGISYSLPYIYPYVTQEIVNKWASIPLEAVLEFSEFAMNEAYTITCRLEMQGIVTLDDLMQSQKMRVSIPYHRDNMGLNSSSTIFQAIGRSNHRTIPATVS